MDRVAQLDEVKADGWDRAGAWALSAGAGLLFLGTLFYLRLPPVLGLPAPVTEVPQALSAALAVGPGPMARAGGVALMGDLLLVAAAWTLANRGASGRERFGWALLALSVLPAIIFDSLMAAALHPLALAGAASFGPFKAWFDLLFAAGNLPFGVATLLLSVEDARRARPVLPPMLNRAGVALGLVACAGSLAALLGLVVPQAIGGPVILGCVFFGVFGVRLARHQEATP